MGESVVRFSPHGFWTNTIDNRMACIRAETFWEDYEDNEAGRHDAWQVIHVQDVDARTDGRARSYWPTLVEAKEAAVKWTRDGVLPDNAVKGVPFIT